MFAKVCLPDSEKGSLALRLPPNFLVPLTRVLSCYFKTTSEVLKGISSVCFSSQGTFAKVFSVA